MSAEYVLPVGLQFDAPPSGLEEGYEVLWRDDEDLPHYLFYAQVSALRLERLARAALECLPPRCHAVLEVRRSDEDTARDPVGPPVDRWISDLVPRRDVLRILHRYRYPLLHDGMVGFGAYDPESPLEVFVDDHKLLSLFAPGLDPFETLLAGQRIPHREGVGAAFDEPHDHYTLPAIPAAQAPAAGVHLRRRTLDVAWFGLAIRTRLGMTLQPLHADERADE